MACPYFVPREILNDGSWPHPARLPLGAGWSGECCASGRVQEANKSHVRDFCNLGYAARCPHLPVERDWDAVRFCVVQAGGGQIVLSYVCERAHAPVEHGTLSFDLRDGRRVTQHADARVQRLAESYLHAYRNRQTAWGIE